MSRLLGAPGWLLGDASQPMFDPSLVEVHANPGLGLTRARWGAPPVGLGPSHALDGLGFTRARWGEPPHLSTHAQLGAMELFESPLWRNRKWLVLGGIGLLGLAGLAIAGAVLR